MTRQHRQSRPIYSSLDYIACLAITAREGVVVPLPLPRRLHHEEAPRRTRTRSGWNGQARRASVPSPLRRCPSSSSSFALTPPQN